MRASKNKIYIAKEKIQTLQQGEVRKLVKAERTTRKQVIRKLLFVAPFVWIPILLLSGFQSGYYCECVDEGIRINRYAYLRKVETYLCPRESLSTLQATRVSAYRYVGICLQYTVNNQIMTLLEAPVQPRSGRRSLFSVERKIAHYYLDKVKQLTTRGQKVWFFPHLLTWLGLIPFSLVFTCGVGFLCIQFSAEDPRGKSNPT